MRNIHKLSRKIFNRDKPYIKFYNASKKTKLDVYPIIDFNQYVTKGVIEEDKERYDIAKNYWKNLKKGNKYLIKSRRIIFRIKEKIFKFNYTK